MQRFLLHSVLLLLPLILSSNSFAWGARGHRIIAALAQQYLTASAQAAVNEILDGEDLATVSTWPDDMRSSQDNVEFWSRRTVPWHFVDIPAGEDYATAPHNPAGDAFAALETFSAILLDEQIPQGPVRDGLELYFGELQSGNKQLKGLALRFVIHILGDLQQPMHIGYPGDQGGNAVRLRWFGEATNLHSLWDTRLVEHSGLSYSEYAERLRIRISRTPASDIRSMERGDAELWVDESQHMLERIYAAHAENTELGYDYAAQFVPTVELQMVKGGLRTAHFLNSIFGGWGVGSRQAMLAGFANGWELQLGAFCQPAVTAHAFALFFNNLAGEIFWHTPC